MAFDVVMPQMGESIAEATILKWHRKVGEQIGKDETLYEISTDKVDAEIPSPIQGTLLEILVDVNITVPVGSVVARLGDASELGHGGSITAAVPASMPASAIVTPVAAPVHPMSTDDDDNSLENRLRPNGS